MSWYSYETFGDLQQGDILLDCPVPLLTEDQVKSVLARRKRGEVGFEDRDIVLLTQTCDLAQGNCKHVLACPMYKLSEYQEYRDSSANKQKSLLLSMAKNQKHGFFLLNSDSSQDASRELRVVEFKHPLSIPFALVQAMAAIQNPRQRLTVPFREAMAQEFGKYLMRVAIHDDEQIRP